MDKAPSAKNIENLPEGERNKIEEIRSLINQIGDIDPLAWNELMLSLKALRKGFDDTNMYSELYQCKLWNACTGSSIHPEQMPEMDLPGNIIENMVREKYESLKK